MNVYVDHHNKPIFEWIEEEENEDQDYRSEEDEDSVLSDTYSVDHEEDDVEYPFPSNKTIGDRRLWSYGHEILRTNPRSTVRIDVDIIPDSTTLFSKYYVCFKVVSDGWKEGRRPMIGLDSCFLKVWVENKATWMWFIDLLMDDIDGGLGAGITLLFNGHKGLVEAVKEMCLEAEHRQYARDIVAHFAKRHARRKPIITMLEEIRIFVMEKIYSQRVEGIEWDLTICPSIRKLIQDLKVKQRLWGVTPCGYQKYEVRFNDAAYGVDLIAKTCRCRIWQLIGISCLHRVAAISSLNQYVETYVSQSYSK
ncbi:unnamed protein product [Lactuca saligna]|uniref:SWIM-type domain-containing protein n=1 Tax=Lactuca saligna TaxID=75948 RepID=A0AA35YUY9_LACSI|nr:unnamed protein product [Lactuca saligna]